MSFNQKTLIYDTTGWTPENTKSLIDDITKIVNIDYIDKKYNAMQVSECLVNNIVQDYNYEDFMKLEKDENVDKKLDKIADCCIKDITYLKKNTTKSLRLFEIIAIISVIIILLVFFLI
jgi:hypothetical protein